MNNKFRIVLDGKFLPVQVFFNAIPDRAFIETLNAFKDGVGAVFNDAYCGFPGEEEFGEEPLTGIEFVIKGEEVVIDYGEFLSILERVCELYEEKCPDQSKQVSELFLEIESKIHSF